MSKLVLRPGFGVLRLIVLAVAVLLEAVAVLSVVLQTAFVPLGAAYPNAISVAAFVLPTVVGFLCQRFEAAIVLAVLPFWTMVLIYVGVYAPVYNTDLLQLGTLAGPVAGSSFLLAGLGLLGWMVRRAVVARGRRRSRPSSREEHWERVRTSGPMGYCVARGVGMSDDSIRCPEVGDIPAVTAAFADGRGGAGGHHKRYLEEQRQGIGSRLFDGAARRIADRAPVAGIGVGLTSD